MKIQRFNKSTFIILCLLLSPVDASIITESYVSIHGTAISGFTVLDSGIPTDLTPRDEDYLQTISYTPINTEYFKTAEITYDNDLFVLSFEFEDFSGSSSERYLAYREFLWNWKEDQSIWAIIGDDFHSGLQGQLYVTFTPVLNAIPIPIPASGVLFASAILSFLILFFHRNRKLSIV